MLFSDHPRTHYRNAPAHEVICQLRFPSILTINSVEPADFQEAIRAEFPQYARRQDAAPPRITGLGSPNPKVEQQPPVTNHNFVSEDNQWKLNLTKDFIALSTLHYPGWEEFARQLDKPLAAFIRLYKPAYFQRVGLRYVNIFSRARLGLEGALWAELFSPAYTAPMQEAELPEDRFLNCAYKLPPKLDFNRIAEIAENIPTPLVLHGGSGLSDSDFRTAVERGISKVNIFTDINQACARAAALGYREGMGLTDIILPEIEAVKQSVMEKMRLFGSVGRGSER